MSDRGATRLTAADRGGVARHVLAMLVFGLLAVSGAGVFRQEVPALAVPFLITGVAGAIGAAVVAVAVHWRPDFRVQRAARLAMVLAALAVAGTGIALAPAGAERGFVIGVAGLLAVLLVAFALVTGPSRRR